MGSVWDANQDDFDPITRLEAEGSRYRPNCHRSVRMGKCERDLSTLRNSTGKCVPHGIYFDPDSDRLKPESGSVLKQVAAGFQKNPNLKLEIDGFTDSAGDAAHNLDLSKRRAQA